MAYRIRSDEPLDEAVRRIAHEQVDRATAELNGLDADNARAAIHQSRKRLKKLRGLVRLVRPALGKDYRPANSAFRDAARELSPYRDAHALAATFDAVIAADPQRLPVGGLTSVWSELVRRADESTRSLSQGSVEVQRAVELLDGASRTIDTWPLDGADWDAVSGGLTKTYRRGVDALVSVGEQPTPERFHELRKRAKYTWYHLRLLTDIAPPVLRPAVRRLGTLSDSLGDAHDLAVLRDMLLDDPDGFGGGPTVEAALVLLDEYRSLLERRSVTLAEWLYAERPEAFAERLGAYWALRNRPPEGNAGELSALFPPDDAWAGSTVAELRVAARSVDVPGRSKMRRERLVAALRAGGIHPDSSST